MSTSRAVVSESLSSRIKILSLICFPQCLHANDKFNRGIKTVLELMMNL
jgi:hypothetical protein